MIHTKPYGPDPKPEKKEKEQITAKDFQKKYGSNRRKKSKTEKQSLTHQLDDWFSRRVRLEFVDEYGMCACVSCAKRLPPKDMDCGHYFNRDNKSLRWDLDNAGPQCPVRKFGCNSKMDRPEVQMQFRETLVARGVDIDKLTIRKNNVSKIDKFGLECLINANKGRVNELLKEKGIKKWW